MSTSDSAQDSKTVQVRVDVTVPPDTDPEALEQLRADRKGLLYGQVRDQLGVTLSNVELYRAAGPHVSTVAGVTRKLNMLPDVEIYRLAIARPALVQVRKPRRKRARQGPA